VCLRSLLTYLLTINWQWTVVDGTQVDNVSTVSYVLQPLALAEEIAGVPLSFTRPLLSPGAAILLPPLAMLLTLGGTINDLCYSDAQVV